MDARLQTLSPHFVVHVERWMVEAQYFCYCLVQNEMTFISLSSGCLLVCSLYCPFSIWISEYSPLPIKLSPEVILRDLRKLLIREIESSDFLWREAAIRVLVFGANVSLTSASCDIGWVMLYLRDTAPRARQESREGRNEWVLFPK